MARGDKGYRRSWKNLLINKRYQLRFTLFMVGLSTMLMLGLGLWVLSEARKATTVGINDILGRDCGAAPGSAIAAPAPDVAPAPAAEPGAPDHEAEDRDDGPHGDGERPRIQVEIGAMTLEPPEPAAAAPVVPAVDVSRCRRQQEAQIQELKTGYGRIKLVLIALGVLMVLGLTLYGIKTTHRVAGPLHKVTLYFDKLRSGTYDQVYNLRKGDQLVEFYEQFKAAHAGLKKMQEEDIAALRAILEVAEREDLGSRSPDLAVLIDELRQALDRKETSLG